jgi:hypothetical protein
MNARTFRPSGSVLIAAVALVIGLEAPAAAHQIAHKISGSDLKPNSVTGKQVKESTLATVPKAREAKALPPLAWHRITTFFNNWEDYGHGTRPAASAVDAQGIVHFRGMVSGGLEGNLAFGLPKRLLPTNSLIDIPVQGSGGIGFLFVSPPQHGIVVENQQSAEDDLTAGTSLDGVSYSIGK